MMGMLNNSDDPEHVPYEPLPSFPVGDVDTPELAGAESFELEAHSNLDRFFSRIYKFWQGKGFYNIVLKELTNLVALLFTICSSAFLLLFVDWDAINQKCIKDGSCSLAEVILVAHPLAGHSLSWILWRILYLVFFSMYWLYTLVIFVVDIPGMWDVKCFCNNRLGISERDIQWLSWPEVVQRVVLIQSKIRLCVTRDLTEHDIVSRIMRKENYLIGMLNKGVLILNLPVPGFRRRYLLTKTLEWNILRCVMDSMFDENFQVKEKFQANPEALKKRFRRMAVVNLLLAPFVLIFLVIYFLMKNVEKFYRTPSTIAARGWSPLARWHIREFNEMPHMMEERLLESLAPSMKYIDQFPNLKLMHIGKLLSFIVGSFAALVLIMALLEDSVLEGGQFLGKSLVWWAAVLTVTLKLCRAFIQERRTFDPEGAMREVVDCTHYMPRHWRGRSHTKEVQQEFQKLFQYKAQIFVEELASVVLTPFVLFFSLPRSADAILQFVRNSTVHVSGVGDVCSYSAFNFSRHGNYKYGSPFKSGKQCRSRQGKMEKSCLSFTTLYTTWEPQSDVKKMLANLLPYAYTIQSPGAYNFLGAHGMHPAVRRRTGNSSATGSLSEHDSTQAKKGVRHVGGLGAGKIVGNGVVGLNKDKTPSHVLKNIEMSALQQDPRNNSKECGETPLNQANFNIRSQTEHQNLCESSTTQASSSVSWKESTLWDEICSNPLAVTSPSGQRLHVSPRIFATETRHAALKDRLKESHEILQRFYSDHDETVQHSMENLSAQFQRGTWMDWVRPPDS